MPDPDPDKEVAEDAPAPETPNWKGLEEAAREVVTDFNLAGRRERQGAEESGDSGCPGSEAWDGEPVSLREPGSYEIREYEPAKWVSTSVESMDWDAAVQTGFTKLHNYIQGKNEKEVKIKMTTPVTSYVEPGSGPFCQSTITISLYIPAEHQSDPPKPSESDVFIEDRAAMTVFVR
ncbi:heme-binding protein 2 isoform X3 [Petaurus breviceps papuanus]